jgi:L-asparaginase II
MIRIQPGVPLVEVVRSGVVESLHTGHLLVVGPDGNTVLAVGDVTQPIFGRSSVKPLQAVGMLRAGFDPSPTDLALGTASHSGSARHRALIEATLTDAGLTEGDLDCPADLPIGVQEQRDYLAAGLTESRLAMNCSGKHAAMLRTCLVNGWPVSGYLAPSHPLQRALAATVSELSGEPIATTGVDGCGAPLFAISLTGLATAFARIARATTGPESRVAEAMRTHPELVAGDGRSATRLMQGIGGLIAKDGAEGVFAAALPDGGAVACKIVDGSSRAADRVVVQGLRRLGVSAAVLDDLESEVLLGGGVPVGAIGPILP